MLSVFSGRKVERDNDGPIRKKPQALPSPHTPFQPSNADDRHRYMAMTMMMMMNVVIGILRVMNVVMILIMFKISERQNRRRQGAGSWSNVLENAPWSGGGIRAGQLQRSANQPQSNSHNS